MTQISVGAFWTRLLLLSITCVGILPVVRAQSPLQDSLLQKQGIELHLAKFVIAGVEKPLPAEPIIPLKLVGDGLLGGNSGINSYFGGFAVADTGHVQW